MDIKSLKDKILQLAIQGKLVPQNENDEPASVLLEKIRLEKEKLIKDKVIKKEKSFPEIDEDEKRFELPNGWEWIRLGEFIRFIGGNQPPKSTFKYEYQDGYIRLIQIRDYKSDSHITYIPIEKAKRFCGKDEVMIGRYGPPIFQILKGIEGAYNVALMKADPIEGISKDYLFYLLKDHLLLRKLEHLASRTCGQDGIDMDTLKSYVVGLPPLGEQERIVAKIDELFQLVDSLGNNKQELLENIYNSRNKVLQLAIQGKLVEQCEDDEPTSILLEKIKEEKEQLIKNKIIKKEKPLPEISEEEKRFELPKGWEWYRLGEAGYFQKGFAFKSKDYVDEGIKITKVSNLNNPNSKDLVYIDIVNESLYEQYKLYNDDIVLTTVGSWPTAPASVVGNAIYINDNFDNTLLNQNAVRIRSKLNQEYLYIVLNSKLFKNYIIDIAQGTANQASITQDGIKSFVFPVPPLEEQKRIVDKVDLIMDYLDKLQQEIESQEIILEDILQ